MTTLEWDKSGEKFFQTGIDRGVLYLADGTAVAWSGLTSVDDGSNSELKSFFLDGVKYLDSVTPGEFSGKLKAITYPDEFDQVQGIVKDNLGLSYYEQPFKKFGLSYRTRIGNDIEGPDYGYKIHILYNLVAVPETSTFETIADSVQPMEFSWNLTGVPQALTGYRPTVHISVDSRTTSPDVLEVVENTLYGTDTSAPRLPSISEIREMIEEFGFLIITDNGDGSYKAYDPGDQYIVMDDPTTFEINGANAVYLDNTTYELSDTHPPLAPDPDAPYRHLILRGPSVGVWAITATDDGTLDVALAAPGILATDRYVFTMQAPDGGLWDISPTDDGVLDIVASGPYEYPQPLQLKSPNGTLWTINVTNDGTIDVSTP